MPSRICFIFYRKGDTIASVSGAFTGDVEERGIVDTAKKYDLVGGGLDEKMNDTLRQIKDMKLELNTIIEVIPVFGSFAFNLIYPSEFNENVEICADLVLDKLLPELQVILDKKIS